MRGYVVDDPKFIDQLDKNRSLMPTGDGWVFDCSYVNYDAIQTALRPGASPPDPVPVGWRLAKPDDRISRCVSFTKADIEGVPDEDKERLKDIIRNCFEEGARGDDKVRRSSATRNIYFFFITYHLRVYPGRLFNPSTREYANGRAHRGVVHTLWANERREDILDRDSRTQSVR